MAEWSSRYSYFEANVREYAPAAGGVYRLINKSGDKYFIFYVGKSDNLRRRLLEHLSPSEPDVCIKRHLRDYGCFFRFIELSSIAKRDLTEQEQIDKWEPDCNG